MNEPKPYTWRDLKTNVLEIADKFLDEPVAIDHMSPVAISCIKPCKENDAYDSYDDEGEMKYLPKGTPVIYLTYK